MLHEKELILNKNQTADYLASVETMKEIVDILNRNTVLAVAGRTLGAAPQAGAGEQGIMQNIEINAQFPDATAADEIKMAFDSLLLEAA